MRTLLVLLFLGPAVFAKEPYIVAGDKIERDYLNYNKKLESHYHKLKKLLMKEAPEYLEKLSPVPPAPIKAGYQLLPKLTDFEAREKNAPKTSSAIYSWPKTRELLDTQLKDLRVQVRALKKIEKLNYSNLVENYRALDDNQQTIGLHVEYNRMWQRQIVHYPERYKENNTIIEQLNSGRETPESTMVKILKKPLGVPHSSILLKVISEKKKIIQVALATDIEDKKFLEVFKEVVEKNWQFKEDGYEYRVELNIRFVSPENLYLPEKPPMKGDDIDIVKHVAHFPKTEIPMSTGTGLTHVGWIEGKDSLLSDAFLAIGVDEISKNILAHEFGHVLTLNDAYIRGYKRIGKNGFEINEVVPDYTDIMAAPAFGSVKKHHFDLVIEALEKRNN